ncbi:MAG TPA: hypothetical protein VGP72_15090 [Planctomycetota bacterium]|jgi:anti-anti-sigma regulatory factor
MPATFDVFGDVLFITGNLDRATDNDLKQALEKYGKTAPKEEWIVDMSNVKWLAPTGGKELINAAQEANDKGARMRVMASRHVLQTLNLLGAKTWVSIESCMTPNPKPGAEEKPAPAASTPASSPAPDAGQPKAAAPAAGAASAEKHDESPAAAVAAAAEAIPAAPRVAGAMAGAYEELQGGAHLLRVIHPNRRYNFHFTGGDLILGSVRERIGGSWIVVEAAGARKFINLDMVVYCEVM